MSAKVAKLYEFKNQSAILWRIESETHPWIVDVTLRGNGDVAICSGDTKHEWYIIVSNSDVEHLRRILSDHVLVSDADDVISLLRAQFTCSPDAANPFEDIKQFFNEQSVRWKSDFW